MPLFDARMAVLKDRLADSRSGRVLFVAHCLLNENTRYPGGAFCPGVMPGVADLISGLDAGLVQVICPERVAWGGVDKRLVYGFMGLGRAPGMGAVSRLAFPLAWRLLNARMGWVARYTAAEIRDYLKNGMQVLGYVGVGGSPSCGVNHAPDVAKYFEWFAKTDPGRVTREEQNEVLARTTVPGRGVFIERLKKCLGPDADRVPFLEHDLLAEMAGKPSTLARDLRIAMGRGK